MLRDGALAYIRFVLRTNLNPHLKSEMWGTLICYAFRYGPPARVIIFKGKVYRTFPKADPVENGHIRKLVRFLGINPSCASKHLPGVIKDAKERENKEEAEEIKPKPKSAPAERPVKKR